MIQRKTLVTALSGVLVGGLLLTGGLAVAGDTGSSVSDNLAGKMPFFGKMMNHRGGMGKGVGALSQQQISDTLKAVVEKGIITQEQSDKILKRYADAEKEHAALDQKMENMTLKEIRQYMQDNKGKAQKPLQGLVSDGVITQEQVDAINTFMRETAQKQQQQQMSDSLKTLVDKGTITREQSDKIVKKIEGAQKERAALMEKVKDMSAEERRQYMQDNKEKLQPQNPISQLVADGTITQKQADAIREIHPMQKGFKGGKGGHGGFRGGFGGEFKGRMN